MLKNMKLGTKQIGGFAIISAIICIVGAVGWSGLITTGSAFDVAMEEQLPIADASMEAMIALISGRDLMGEFMLTEDTGELDDAEEGFDTTVADFDQHAGYIRENGTGKLKQLADQAEQYHAVFQENAIELMQHQRLHIASEGKADLLMMDFDQHAADLKGLLSDYEENLTQDQDIDDRVDAAMEAKSFMFEQKAIAEEYMGLEALGETGALRQEFTAKETEFDALEDLLPQRVVEEHADFCKLAREMFDQHDETLRMSDETRNHMALVDEYSEKADLTMDQVEEAAQETMAAAMATADAAQTSAKGLIATITVLGFLLGLTFGFLISRSITKPLGRVIDGLNAGAEQVASASAQVSTSSQDLAEGSSEQAASIEETSSSLEEMSSMTRQNADNSTEADGLMKDGNQIVEKANASMAQLTVSMEDISTASEETSKIIKTIDEIAFQTNLLALNAAVEAARAGEAGAGFAVVADEVRNLALRAAEAAKSTADLIDGTVKRIEDGSELVSSANDAFGDVSASISKVGELVGEIATASEEQAHGIEQVNITVAEMDKTIQSSAANAEESASVSEKMKGQADRMKVMVTELMTLVGGSSKSASVIPVSGAEPPLTHTGA